MATKATDYNHGRRPPCPPTLRTGISGAARHCFRKGIRKAQVTGVRRAGGPPSVPIQEKGERINRGRTLRAAAAALTRIEFAHAPQIDGGCAACEPVTREMLREVSAKWIGYH